MALSLFQLSLLFILFSAMSNCAATHSDDCFRLSAAFNYKDKIYLVDGGEYIKLSSSLEEIGTGTLNADFDGIEGHVDAALIYGDDKDLEFFHGNNYDRYTSLWGAERLYENSDWSPFFEGSIDAAGTSHGESYFFKECKYIVGDIKSVEHDVHGIGLPCDINAAWNHKDELFVTKGDKLWIIDVIGHVHGPEKLSDFVTLTSTTFCHEEGDPHTLKVRAEQKYEKEHSCVIIDAAINNLGDVFIFNDDKYIGLDSKGNENGLYSNLEWSGLGANLDAGITWPGDYASYFFKGSTYYKNHWGSTHGPFGNELWAPFLEEGIDAAGNHEIQSYFFKGCEIASYSIDKEVTAVHKNEDLGLPCDVNAAFSRGKYLYVIKRDQVWTWRLGEDKATGPAPLSTVAQMSSWTACPADAD